MGKREQLGAYLRDRAIEFLSSYKRNEAGLYVPRVVANADLKKYMGRGHFEKFLPWIKRSVMKALLVAGPIGPVELERTTALVLYMGPGDIRVHLAPHDEIMERMANFGLLEDHAVVGTNGSELQINGEKTRQHIFGIESTRTEHSIHIVCMNAEPGSCHMDTDRNQVAVRVMDEGSISSVMEKRPNEDELGWLQSEGRR